MISWGFVAAALLAQSPDVGAVNAYELPTSWRDERGKSVLLSSFRGSQVVLAFVYTGCPGTCPLTTAKLKRLDKALLKQGKKPTFLVLSLDPAHDTEAAVAGYRARFALGGKTNWHVLVPTEEDLRKLTMLLEFRYSKNADTQEIMHDNKVYLLSEEGELLDTMPSLDDEFASFAAKVKAAPSKKR